MNIAFVTSTRKWGGVKTWHLESASSLFKDGHNIHFYSRQPEFVDAAKKYLPSVNQIKFGSDFNPFVIYYFWREFKRNQIDVVVTNVTKDLTTAGIAAKILKIPIVQGIGNPNDMAPRAKIKYLHKFLDPYFLCPSKFIADNFKLALPWVSDARTKVILNGKTPSTKQLQANTPRNIIVTQQLVPHKDHKTLLLALSELKKYPFILHIVGTGDMEQELKDYARELDLKDRIIWHGFSNQVPELLAKSDIFVLTSLIEGLPNTLLEALAEGLIPICRNVGGVKEVLTDELDPWLLPYKANHDDFREKLHKALLLNDNEVIQIKNMARDACINNCNMKVQDKLLEEWLKTI